MLELYAQKAITGDDNDSEFGRSVAISGNYCIVGDENGDGVAGNTGHAFIYERQRNGDWKQVKALTGDENDNQFGWSVAISGNYCIVGDNTSTKGGAVIKGHAFIYERQRNGEWKQVKALTGDADDVNFGRSVAISGNYCIVGDNDGDGGTKPGHAFIYERQRNGEWKQVKALTGDDDDLAFGYSVAISGNYCIVGDHLGNTGDTGHAFIYERQRNGEWKQVKALTGDANDAFFGWSVAISGNYCIVGDYESERGTAGDKGHAFIYERQRNGDWKQVKALTGDANDSDFGRSVAISGNYCIVGDEEGNDGDKGRAFIYERQRNGEWKQVKAITGDTNDDDFGRSVAISGNYCIVGDYDGNTGDKGHAFIYELKLV